MTIQLTFTQCKQIQDNLYGGDTLRDIIERMNDQPEFMIKHQSLDYVADFQAILQGGCASGAYMPAVTYNTALQMMLEYSNEIETILEDCQYEPIVWDVSEETFASFCSKCVTQAVEHWVSDFNDVLDGVNWD